MQYENEAEVEQFVRGILSAMVSCPGEIVIDRIYTEAAPGDLPTLELKIMVSPEDAGQVIGKQGRTARSLRTLVGAMANRRNIRVSINLNIRKEEQELALA